MPDSPNTKLMSYANVPRPIAMVIGSQMASLHELQTIYSVEDMYDMIEVLMVDNHNEQAVMKESSRG